MTIAFQSWMKYITVIIIKSLNFFGLTKILHLVHLPWLYTITHILIIFMSLKLLSFLGFHHFFYLWICKPF